MDFFGFIESIENNSQPVKKQEPEIKVLSICKFWDNHSGLSFDEQLQLDWDASSKLVMDWCEKNNYHYYANPREDFFIWEGVEEAKKAGKVGVIVEDLS
jgi:hypothetical protein